jgi:hypothetical protein
MESDVFHVRCPRIYFKRSRIGHCKRSGVIAENRREGCFVGSTTRGSMKNRKNEGEGKEKEGKEKE